MINPQELLKAYDLLREEDGTIDATKLEDKQIDELIETMWDMQKAVEVLIAHKKKQAMIRIKASKEEKDCEVFIRRIMQRLELESFDCEYGKVKTTLNYRYDYDIDKLPDEYKMISWSKVWSALRKWESIKWVTKTDWYLTVRIT